MLLGMFKYIEYKKCSHKVVSTRDFFYSSDNDPPNFFFVATPLPELTDLSVLNLYVHLAFTFNK